MADEWAIRHPALNLGRKPPFRPKKATKKERRAVKLHINTFMKR